jgi:hypothetical protein
MGFSPVPATPKESPACPVCGWLAASGSFESVETSVDVLVCFSIATSDPQGGVFFNECSKVNFL